MLTFLGNNPELKPDRQTLWISFELLIIGVTAAMLSIGFAYLAQQQYSHAEYVMGANAYLDVAGVPDKKLDATRNHRWGEYFRWPSIVFGFASLGFFFGCLTAMHALI